VGLSQVEDEITNSFFYVEDLDETLGFFNVGMNRKFPPPRLTNGSTWLNVGAGNKPIVGATSLDLPDWDANLNGLRQYGDHTIDGIIALHFLEHVDQPVAFLADCQRVLRHLGTMWIVVPYGTGSGGLAVHDLTHKHFFNEDTFRNLFSTEYYTAPGTPDGGWQFDITFNMIMGESERNLALFTQLQRK
jgi:SAM-dependent methyltransferase